MLVLDPIRAIVPEIMPLGKWMQIVGINKSIPNMVYIQTFGGIGLVCPDIGYISYAGLQETMTVAHVRHRVDYWQQSYIRSYHALKKANYIHQTLINTLVPLACC